jgi:hypothetical protein
MCKSIIIKSIDLLDIKILLSYNTFTYISKEGNIMSNNTLLASTIAASCPISNKRIDSHIIRAISFQVALFAMILLFTQELFFAMILLFDFLVRTLRLQKISPFYLIAEFILTGWGIAPKLCDESPKRFALYLGLTISIFVVLLYIVQLYTIATVIIAILFICALLETMFDFCIGCKIYYAIKIVKGLVSARNIK